MTTIFGWEKCDFPKCQATVAKNTSYTMYPFKIKRVIGYVAIVIKTASSVVNRVPEIICIWFLVIYLSPIRNV